MRITNLAFGLRGWRAQGPNHCRACAWVNVQAMRSAGDETPCRSRATFFFPNCVTWLTFSRYFGAALRVSARIFRANQECCTFCVARVNMCKGCLARAFPSIRSCPRRDASLFEYHFLFLGIAWICSHFRVIRADLRIFTLLILRANQLY